MDRLTGIGVSSGRASGPLAVVAEPLAEPPATPAPHDPAAEAARISPAAQAVADALFSRAAQTQGEAKAVLEVTAAMAMDPALISAAEQLVSDQAIPAPRAVYEAAATFAESLRAAGGYLAERVRDVHDVRDRIIANLMGVQVPGVPVLASPSVLIARDLAPADTAELDPSFVLALVTAEGGPTSHTAILARSLGIPAVVAARGVLERGGMAGAAVDGDSGVVELSEQAVPVHTAEGVAHSDWDGIGRTADDQLIKVLANVGAASDAQAAAAAGAEGVGLFRTEVCYLAASEEPDVATQRATYAEILAPFAGKPVVVRTLDAGADKSLPFLGRSGGASAEPNPALGVRGLRLSFERTGVLDRQLEAIAAAAGDSGADVSVMAPMVATAGEAAWFAEKARAAGISSAGVMIEVPAAALSASEILDAVDFLSIGTNDLAQYFFAADRMLGAVADLNDPWQPALLRLIGQIGRAGGQHGKAVGVCGEAAADPQLARVLVGLGVTSLSMMAAAVPTVGAALAGGSVASYRSAADGAMSAPDPAGARAAVREVLGG